MHPSLSVVIPVKDDAAALLRCLEALAAQSRTPLEIVVVDNGSRDDSAAVAVAHGARVVDQPAPGIPAAASTGYDAAVGDVVVRCDADTVPPPDWLARIADRFAADPALDALTGTGLFYDVPRWRAVVVGRAYLTSYYVWMHAALAHPPLWGSNMAMRRARWVEVSASVHRDDPEVHDDVDLAFALGPRARIAYDRHLVVAVSGRSLHGRAQLHRRFVRAFHTLAVNWRTTPPWERWAVRLRAGRPGGTGWPGGTGRPGGRRSGAREGRAT